MHGRGDSVSSVILALGCLSFGQPWELKCSYSRAEGSVVMRTVQASALFPVPPDQAWEFVFGDQGRRAAAASKMGAAIENYRIRGDGTPIYTLVMKVGPIALRSVSDYDIFDRPRRTANQVLQSPFGGRFFVDFRPTGGGTMVTTRWEMNPSRQMVKMLLPILAPLMAYVLRRELSSWAAAAAS
ncbi:hypothetical protein MN0502_02520 [Arthrobacter sp. MN05-02]|nr:hypothetical protein MN0502_02520 [Arthrobacter sp. MN05-02]